jgi:parvulin-like peptidyl-prolyl isomerase
MPKQNKKVKDNNELPKKLPETKEAKQRRRRTNAIITASAILAFIIIVAGGGWYWVYQVPLKAPVIKVNDQTISIMYLLNLTLMNSSAPTDTMSMIQSIIDDCIVEQVASQPPYNIKVTEADIDKGLRAEANAYYYGADTSASSTTATTTTTAAKTVTDAEFNEWYRQQLNKSQLSAAQFRDLEKVSLIETQLETYLEARMPTTTDQLHVYDIVANDLTTAQDIQTRINNGEDFQTIAKEQSQDSNTAAKGGDMGWLPLTALDSSLSATANNLPIGQVSAPVQTSTAAQAAASSSNGSNTEPYYLLMVTEKSTGREIDPQYVSYLQTNLLQDWLAKESGIQKIKLLGKGAQGGYDSETSAFLQYEIQKLAASRGITLTTTTTSNNLLGQ